MTQKMSKLNPAGITQTRKHFLAFLQLTEFPHPQRNGDRGSKFSYPEWVIMFIAVLSVKCKVKSSLGIHRMVRHYWPQLAAGLDVPPISESQLRDRLKKICHAPGSPARFILQVFPGDYLD
jgi:hypothetical protein